MAALLPMVMWEIGNVPNELQDLANGDFSQNIEIVTVLLLTT